MDTEENKTDGANPVIAIIFAILLVAATAWAFTTVLNVDETKYQIKEKKCLKMIRGEDELYCKLVMLDTCGYGGCFLSSHQNLANYSIGNKTQDEIARIEAEKQAEAARKTEAIKKLCYDNGYWVNKTFDVRKDYNLSCQRIAYINDHLVDNVEQKDGGYIKGSMSGGGFGVGFGGFGFGTVSGSVDGQFYQYVVTRILATGQLAEWGQYHVDCNNNISDMTVDLYDEAEFVMYYTNMCIQ